MAGCVFIHISYFQVLSKSIPIDSRDSTDSWVVSGLIEEEELIRMN